MKTTLRLAVLGVIIFGSFASAQTEYYLEGAKIEGKHHDVGIWKGGAEEKLCMIDGLALLHGQKVALNSRGDDPLSCERASLGKVPSGTKVREITPAGDCALGDKLRRVRVLDGPLAGQVGCVAESVLASERTD
jgi:hypothetical protein